MKPLHSQRIKQNQRILLVSKKQREGVRVGGWVGKGERESKMMGGCEGEEDSEEDSERHNYAERKSYAAPRVKSINQLYFYG